jgi:RecA-family ATPase
MTTPTLLEEIQKAERDAEERLAEIRKLRDELLGENGDRAPVVPLTDFLAERNTDFEWLIGGSLAADSVVMVAGDPATGKTTLLVQIALCLAAGRAPFYDAHVAGPIPCLYIAAEGSRGAFQARVATARKALGIAPGAAWFIQKRGTTDFRIGSPTLEAMVAKTKAKLVVLDTIGYFHTGDENNANDWKRCVMVPLRNLIARHGCTFLLVHHFVKASPDRQGWQRARGTSAMFADLDAFYQLEAAEGDPVGDKRVLVQSKNKYGLTRRWHLTFDAQNARFG